MVHAYGVDSDHDILTTTRQLAETVIGPNAGLMPLSVGAEALTYWNWLPLDVDDLAAAMTQLAAMSVDQRADMARASAAIAERWEPSRFAAGLLAAIGKGKRAGKANYR